MGLLAKIADHLGYEKKAAPSSGMNYGAGVGFFGWSNLGSPAKQLGAMKGLVANCVNIIADTICGLPVMLKKRGPGKSKDWPEIEDHPVLALLAKPNPLQPGRMLLRQVVTHLELTGGAYLRVIENGLRRPMQLWPMFPDRLAEIKTTGDPERPISEYIFLGDRGQRMHYAPEEIISIKYPHAKSLVRGASPIQQQAESYDINEALSNYLRKFFQNMARPDGIISAGDNSTEADAKRLLTLWKESHQGPENAGKTGVLYGGAKYEATGTPPKDMDYQPLFNWLRDCILSAYRVPAAKLGLVEDVNKANGLEVDVTFHRECISPKVALISDVLDIDLAARYAPNLWLHLDHEVPKDREFEHKRQMERLDRGVIVVNEVRSEDGLDDVEGGDVPHIQANMIPLTATLQIGDQGGSEQMALKALAQKGAAEDAEAIAFMAKLRPWELFMKSALGGVFNRQRAEVLGRLAEAWPKIEGKYQGWSQAKVKAGLKADISIEKIFENWDEWTDELKSLVWAALMPGVVQSAGSEILLTVGSDIVFNVAAPGVLEYLQTNAATAAKVNEYTQARLRDALVQAVENGDPLSKITARVNEIFDWCAGPRAETIARTEVATAYRHGHFEGIRQSDAPFKKQWIAEPGARDTHSAAARRYNKKGAIKAEKLFQVGGAWCFYPGTTGTAKEDINCRCHVKYIPDTEGKAAAENIKIKAPEIRAYTWEDCDAGR